MSSKGKAVPFASLALARIPRNSIVIGNIQSSRLAVKKLYIFYLKFENEGKSFFSADGHYDIAIQLYSKAIELDGTKAPYYGNRSFAYLKEELYGSAIEDASKSLELDRNYIKGYYRRATANMALGKFKAALNDYKTVTQGAHSLLSHNGPFTLRSGSRPLNIFMSEVSFHNNWNFSLH